MSDYLVMTAAEEGGFWRADTLFHTLEAAQGHAANLVSLDAQRYTTIVPVVLDWEHQIDAYYPQQEQQHDRT